MTGGHQMLIPHVLIEDRDGELLSITYGLCDGRLIFVGYYTHTDYAAHFQRF